jgi:hypothetical protein
VLICQCPQSPWGALLQDIELVPQNQNFGF